MGSNQPDVDWLPVRCVKFSWQYEDYDFWEVAPSDFGNTRAKPSEKLPPPTSKEQVDTYPPNCTLSQPRNPPQLTPFVCIRLRVYAPFYDSVVIFLFKFPTES